MLDVRFEDISSLIYNNQIYNISKVTGLDLSKVDAKARLLLDYQLRPTPSLESAGLRV